MPVPSAQLTSLGKFRQNLALPRGPSYQFAMAESYDSIDAYIAALPDGVQLLIEAIRQTIHGAAPNAVEAIKYDMPTFRMDGTYIIYLAAWKKHVGLYPVHRGSDAFEHAVAPYRSGKDTVKFPLGKPIPHGLIAEIVAARVAELQRKAASPKAAPPSRGRKSPAPEPR